MKKLFIPIILLIAINLKANPLLLRAELGIDGAINKAEFKDATFFNSEQDKRKSIGFSKYKEFGSGANVFLDIKHNSIPFIPNFHLKYYNFNTGKDDKIDLINKNYIFYYAIVDSIIKLNFGFSLQNTDLIVKKHNGQALKTSGSMKSGGGYVSIALDLPLIPIKPNIDFLLPSNNKNSASIIDAKVKLSLLPLPLIGIYGYIGARKGTFDFGSVDFTNSKTSIDTMSYYLGFSISGGI